MPVRMVATAKCCKHVIPSSDAAWPEAAMNQARIRGLGTTFHQFVAESASL